MNINNNNLNNYRNWLFDEGISFIEFKKRISLLNAAVLEKKVGEDDAGIYDFSCFAGNLISPDLDIQLRILEVYRDVINNIDNDEAKAMLSYYLFNNLHLFSDGNGRLARALYSFFKGNLNREYIYHDKKRNSEANKKSNDKKRHRFLLENKLMNMSTLNTHIGRLVLERKIINGEIINDPRILKAKRIKTHDTDDPINYGQLFIRSEINNFLSDDDRLEINYALLKNDGNITIAGIALLDKLSRLGILDKVLELNSSKRNDDDIILYVNDPSNKDMINLIFKNWGFADYDDIINISRFVHIQNLFVLIDLFLEPNVYMYNEYQTYMDFFLHGSKIKSKANEVKKYIKK